MITRENIIALSKINSESSIIIDENSEIFKDAIFFDLEHYVYKKPVCVGVFGCCYLDREDNNLHVTQYMIENMDDSVKVLYLAEDYFKKATDLLGKKFIITFSGNNDFLVINHLFEKYGIKYRIDENFKSIDLQKEYEKQKKVCIGLKSLEKEFGIFRDSELISGSNLAKTFSKIVKDNDYIHRMPDEKKDKILLYNQQDVVSLFHICLNWRSIINEDKAGIEEIQNENQGNNISSRLIK